MSEPEVVGATEPATAGRVSEVLVGGGVVLLPTDTVYGIAAIPDDADAIARLFALKGRAADAPVAVLCGSAVQALTLASTVSADAAVLAARHWPGPLTIVLPRDADLDWDLGEPQATIGVRCPDHALVRAVTSETGPIAVTSANRHGEPTATEAAVAAASLVGPVDLIVDGGTLAGAASTVVDATGPSLLVLRQGPIALDG